MKPVYFKLFILAAILSLACTTKVSEWVLLNAVPNQYTLVYFYKNSPDEPIIKQNSMLGKEISQANIRFKSVQRKDIDQSYYGLYYGSRFFSRFNDYRDLHGLTTSPLRERIASEIMAGKLCVLLYLQSGDKLKDESGLKIIQESLNSSPFGDVITIIALSRNSKEESTFVSLLLNVEDDLKRIHEPMIFGIFGRFKALEPLLGKGITQDNIRLMIDFLTADCSCLIKDNLPGVDILFTNKWENPSPALVNKILDKNPELMHH
jgi:hypothetical protein